MLPGGRMDDVLDVRRRILQVPDPEPSIPEDQEVAPVVGPVLLPAHPAVQVRVVHHTPVVRDHHLVTDPALNPAGGDNIHHHPEILLADVVAVIQAADGEEAVDGGLGHAGGQCGDNVGVVADGGRHLADPVDVPVAEAPPLVVTELKGTVPAVVTERRTGWRRGVQDAT
eukprot:766572-Hanusia_phi.AAC.2